MRNPYQFAAIALAFLLVIFCAPHKASAQSLDPCGDGSSIYAHLDGTGPDSVANNAASHAQSLVQNAQKAMSQFPILLANNACLKTVLGLMSTFGNNMSNLINNPSSAGGVILNQLQGVAATLVTTIINKACASIMQIINAGMQDITSLARICIPLPKFNLALSLPGISGCSGGVPIQLFSPTGGATTATYNLQSYTTQPH